MSTDIDAQVAVLQQMTLARLRDRYADVFGEPTVVTNNKAWLVKRIAWRSQALAEGDLSERSPATRRGAGPRRGPAYPAATSRPALLGTGQKA